MDAIKIFFVGDVMLARGVDMIQRQHCDPVLYEGNGLDARDYVNLAEHVNGRLPELTRRTPKYVWGDALQILVKEDPDLRVINLETSITTNDKPWPRKGIHYRMHPQNLDVIKAAKVDCCVLSNNHTADWGMDGLRETLSTLKSGNVTYAGAGNNLNEAQSPAVFDLGNKGRILLFAVGDSSSGIPGQWLASHQSGVNLISIESNTRLDEVVDVINQHKQPGDISVVSIHWGGNWGFEVDPAFRRFAHRLIDSAGVDLLHGHSSHHVMGVEVYKDKLIMYGCGDFINDYEGIGGHEEYRGELSLMYFASVQPKTGKLLDLTMHPTLIKKLSIQKAEGDDAEWLLKIMSKECKKLGCEVKMVDGVLKLQF